MAIQITADDYFDTIVYGAPNKQMGDYLTSKNMEYAGLLDSSMRGWYDKSMELTAHYHSDALAAVAREAIRNTSTEIIQNIYWNPTSMKNMQSLKSVMARAMMACPELLSLQRSSAIDGWVGVWEDNWVDVAPGKNHYEYQRMTHGIGMDNQDNKIEFTFYPGSIDEGDDAPSMMDRLSVVSSSWKLALAMVELGGEDPTSSSGRLL